jgi:hypothetical protein
MDDILAHAPLLSLVHRGKRSLLYAWTDAFMKASPNWSKFMRLFNRAVLKPGSQQDPDFGGE